MSTDAEAVPKTKTHPSMNDTPPPEPSARTRRLGRLLRAQPEYLLVPAFFVFVVTTWELIVMVGGIEEYILPPPSAIWDSFLAELSRGRFWTHVRYTAFEAGLGYLIGVVAALVLGIAITQFRLVERTIFPYVVAFQTVPKVAIAPLFVVWFGFGLTSKVVMAALICFFPMLINVIEGLKSTEPEKIELMRSLRASRSQIFRKVQFPNALPFIFAGLNLGVIFAIIGAVVGEFVGARAGLGYQLLQYNFVFDIAGMFATLVALSLMGIAGHLVIRRLQKHYVFWADHSHTIGA